MDYPHLTERVRVELRALGLPGLEQVTVYGRESGHSEYEWEQTAPLLNLLLASEETTVLLEKKGDRLLQDLTVVARIRSTQSLNLRRRILSGKPT